METIHKEVGNKKNQMEVLELKCVTEIKTSLGRLHSLELAEERNKLEDRSVGQ